MSERKWTLILRLALVNTHQKGRGTPTILLNHDRVISLLRNHIIACWLAAGLDRFRPRYLLVLTDKQLEILPYGYLTLATVSRILRSISRGYSAYVQNMW